MEFRTRLDQLLGYVPMYKLVVMGLLAIAMAAVLLMVNGYLVYSPIIFVAMLLVCVATAYGSNVLFGWLFGVRPQAESAVITGLIIALLYSPPETIIGAVKIALVVVIAMASKYVLVWRAKHIFNPAAIAIVLASISGLAYASWWIATPALLPITVIVAFVILYKTQKLQMAGAFLLAAAFVISLRTFIDGETTFAVYVMTLTSWPLVFFAGVMLSEPLTLAPQRKQQIGIAIAVGVLAALPLHYATVTMTPALALVIGNILAFYFGTRRGVTLRFVAKKKQGDDGYEFLFDVPKFQYIPGQYIELHVPHTKADFRGTRRVFSLIGTPGENQVSFATKFPKKHSSFKSALLRLKTGDKIQAVRVAGDFTLPNNEKIPVLAIAGGIGITPFVSFAMNAGGREITILYAPSTEEHIAFAKELAHLNVKVVLVTPHDVMLHDGWQHEKTQLSKELISKYLEPGVEVYVSGPPKMVTNIAGQVKKLGVKKVRTDHFSGY